MTGLLQENLRMTSAELEACRPVRGEGGLALRAFCPFHQSDHQRSLRVLTETGRFHCFACGAWGYLSDVDRPYEASRGRSSSRYPSRSEAQAVDRGGRRQDVWLSGQQDSRMSTRQGGATSRLREASLPGGHAVRRAEQEHSVTRDGANALPEHWDKYQQALPGSLGERYLRWRAIPLELALRLGVGYAANGLWAHRGADQRPLRQWRHGRLVFPHSDPQGRLVNLYGRAVGTDAVPKGLRHDHLPGSKGYFNGGALTTGDGPLYVCEGPFDALSLIASGVPRSIAIFGVSGWRWEWFREVKELVFAFDADRAGEAWRTLAREAVLRGRRVSFVPPVALDGCKDVNEAWVRGVLRLGDSPHS